MTYRIGIIGTGFGAKVHAPVLQAHPNFDVRAISSVYRGNAEQIAAELGIPHAYSDWRVMIQHADLDAVVIASNPAEHMSMSLQALARGLHVLCEKPPALDITQSRSMLTAAIRSKKVAAMNFEWRFLPERQKIKEVVSAGTLGRILHVHWRETALLHVFRDRPNSWLWQTESGGGLFGALGSHMVDSLQYWFGPLSWVQGRTVTHWFARRSEEGYAATDADDSFSFHGEFVSGGTCSVQLTLAAVGLKPTLEIYGTEGTLVFDGDQLKLATTSNPSYEVLSLEPKMSADSFPEAIRGYIHPQWKFYDEFARALSGEPSPDLPSFLDAARVQAVMDAVRRSSQSGREPIETVHTPL